MITDIRVNELKFEAILNGDCTLVAIDDEMVIESIFRLIEDNSLGRIVYARADECVTLTEAVPKKFLGFIPYGVNVVERTVIRFSLTGMIEIEGNSYPMSDQITTEIIKNLNVDRNVDLKLCPYIVCIKRIDNVDEVVAQFKFTKAVIGENNRIAYIQVNSLESGEVCVYSLD